MVGATRRRISLLAARAELHARLRPQPLAEQLDEADRGRVVELVARFVRRQIDVVQRLRRATADRHRLALEQPHAHACQ